MLVTGLYSQTKGDYHTRGPQVMIDMAQKSTLLCRTVKLIVMTNGAYMSASTLFSRKTFPL